VSEQLQKYDCIFITTCVGRRLARTQDSSVNKSTTTRGPEQHCTAWTRFEHNRGRRQVGDVVWRAVANSSELVQDIVVAKEVVQAEGLFTVFTSEGAACLPCREPLAPASGSGRLHRRIFTSTLMTGQVACYPTSAKGRTRMLRT